MSLQLSRQHVLAVSFILAAVIVVAFLLGTAAPRGYAEGSSPVIPTPTPNLTIATPHIIATWFNDTGTEMCVTCNQITFTTHGPFEVVVACNPYQAFADSDPAIEFELLNSGGHVLDTVLTTCGDPNKDKVATNIVPENLAAGTYTMQFYAITNAPMVVMILAAHA